MKLLNLLVILFLFPNIEVSSSSTCKELRKHIKSKHIIGNCAEKNIKLDCQGNNPIFHMRSSMFLVEDISLQNTSFRLVDPSYSAAGHQCPLPYQTITRDSALYSFFFHYTNISVINFLNCTQEIEDPRYELVPCFNRSNSRVYAAASRTFFYAVSDVHDSCSLVGRAMTDYIDEPLEHVGYAAITQAIQRGVLVNWTASKTHWGFLTCSNFEGCWRVFILTFNLSTIQFLLLSLRPASVLYLLLERLSAFYACLYSASSAAFTFMLILTGLFGIVFVMLSAKLLLAPLVVCSFLIHKWWRMSSSVSSIETFLRKNELLHIRRYDFIEIYVMTNHFKEKLGQGGFGSVYKGKLISGQQVAVKMLSNPIGDGDDFVSEVATIGRIHHTNIVRLLEFCSEGSKGALIYAYMPNSSLDKYIFCSSSNAPPVEKRREIAIGIARGIDYLHRGCEMQILHFDIKPHNILLDYNLTPKISDFGLAKLYPRDYSLVALSMARGTIGYIAPELISRTFGVVSYKADVYSFEMLLMEMASGRRNVNNHAESSSQVYYPSWIYDQLNLPTETHYWSSDVGKFGEIEESLYKISLWCIQMKASDRPTMSEVIKMLQSDADSLVMPPRPSMAFSQHEFIVGPSQTDESCSIELSSISEAIN